LVPRYGLLHDDQVDVYVGGFFGLSAFVHVFGGW